MNDVIAFARLLRDAGLGVAPSEIADALMGLQRVDVDSPCELHYRVLQACLVKRSEDCLAFDTLYKVFFVGYPTKDVPSGECDSGSLAALTGTGARAAGLPTLALSMVTGDYTPCYVRLRENVRKVCAGTADFHEQVRQVLVNLDYYSALNSLHLAKTKGQLSEWEYNEAANTKSLEFIRIVERELIKHRLELGQKPEQAIAHLNWRTKSFNLLNPAELAMVHKYLDKIGRKLAVRKGLQLKSVSSGMVNFRGTINKAMSTGGVCYNLVFQQHVPEKPLLVLLCDVSNSVYQFTGFMLQLISAFRQRFDKVKAYVFVDTLWQVPKQQLSEDVSKALKDIRENNRCSITGLSDFGRVFCEFENRELPHLPSDTVLLILGDGNNNWRPPELAAFKAIAKRLKKVYWLNPVPRESWGKEDSQIYTYAPFCSEVFECGNLEQLEQVAKKIL